MARVLSMSEAKTHLSQLVADCETEAEEIVITRNGRPAAVLMSADEYIRVGAQAGKLCVTAH